MSLFALLLKHPEDLEMPSIRRFSLYLKKWSGSSAA